jgi:hypothetical protein
MNAQQQRQQDELRDLLAHYQILRVLYVQRREHLIDHVQAASRDIEHVDATILVVLECQRDLAAEIERTEGVA